jgi:hypothetical protein
MEKIAHSALAIDKKFEECYKLFQQEAYDDKGHSVFKQLHNAFHSDNQQCNNCFGCSIQVNAQLITNYLKKYPSFSNIQNEFGAYILLQHLIIERLETILDMIEIPQSRRDQEFAVFKQIRVWAFLFKPYTTFIPKNRADFILENFNTPEVISQESFVVTNKYVLDYYEKKVARRRLPTYTIPEFVDNNDKRMLIVLPNIVELTDQVCQAYNKFVDLLLSNKEYENCLLN